MTPNEVCCYGIDLSASKVRFNQWEHSISRDLDQWECSTLLPGRPEPRWSQQRESTSPARLSCWRPRTSSAPRQLCRSEISRVGVLYLASTIPRRLICIFGVKMGNFEKFSKTKVIKFDSGIGEPLGRYRDTPSCLFLLLITAEISANTEQHRSGEQQHGHLPRPYRPLQSNVCWS